MQEHIDPWFETLLEIHDNIEGGKTYKRTRGRGEIARHYQNELFRLQQFRAEGKAGRLEFVAWF
jgi:hypothetical protein